MFLLSLSGCKRDHPAPHSQPQESVQAQEFSDVASEVGINHRHEKPVLDHQLDNIMSWVCSVGAAVAAGDFNNDGWIDFYVTNSDQGKSNFLYRNNKDGTFTDVAATAKLANLNRDDGVSMDSLWGDYDNDGWIDLYLVRWGRNSLFRNNGDGTFTEVTAKSFRRKDGSPGTDWANGNAAVFLDYNLDGRLDLYVGNYFDEIDLWHLTTTRIMHDSFERARNAGRNFLFRQEADGTFREVSAETGTDDRGWTLAVGAADVDNDGWPDLYSADDFGPDQLFINRHDGTFENVTESALGSDTKKGMNVDFGDFDNDGWLDVYVANITTAEYLQEGNMLWHNNGLDADGRLSFVDVSLETGTYDGGWGWGAKFFDFDNDGDLDIYAVNGFISAGEGNYWYDLASWTVTGQDPAEAKNWPTIGHRSFSGYERNRFWRNDGLGRFTERAAEVGLDSDRDGRGVACIDYDNDGDIDLFVANQGQPPHLFRHNGRPTNHWLELALEADGHTVNRDAIGTRVTLVTSAGRQIRERDGGNGFSGQSDPRLHFGLGTETHAKLIEVRWPDGGLQYLENVPADQILHLRQDAARYTTTLALDRGAAKVWSRPEKPATPPPPKLTSEELDRMLKEMEEKLLAPQAPAFTPGGTSSAPYALASPYRARCAAYKRHDRSIEFFRRLAAQRPDDARARIELACAFIDKIPTCGGMAAIVSKGTLARQSLDELDRVIAENPDLWVAYYCRGMNHLHWPRALKHSDAAAADFRECLRIQRRTSLPASLNEGTRRSDAATATPQALPPPLQRGGLGGSVQGAGFERTFIGLGDSYAKAGAAAKARDAWREGLQEFPDSTALQERLAIGDDAALLKFVETKRSLDQPIDTDLSFLEREP